MPNLAEAAVSLAELIYTDLNKCLVGMDFLNASVSGAQLAMVIAAFREECNLPPAPPKRLLRPDLDLSMLDADIEALVREWKNFI